MEAQRSKKKQEIWPWAIVGAFSLFIGGIISAIFMMSSANVPLVAEDYYAQEIAYQEQINKENRARFREPIIEFTAVDGPGAMLRFAPGSKVEAGEGNITFFRPSDEDLDFTVPVNPDLKGRQWIDLSQARPGLWIVQVEWVEGGEDYYHESKLLVEG